MATYVINLDRSADRYSSFLVHNAHLDEVTRARAVDGRTLDRGELLARGLIAPNLAYSNGNLGSALSHACLWQIASATDTPTTIAEDDAVFRHDFVAAARDAIAKLPPDWDLVLWGWNFDSILCVELLPGIAPCALLADQLQLRQKIEEFQARPIPAMPIKLLRAFGAVAYSVSAAGAHNLMRLCLPIRPAEILFPVINQVASNNGIDMMMSVAYPRLQAFVSVPPLVVTENRRDISTIQGRD